VGTESAGREAASGLAGEDVGNASGENCLFDTKKMSCFFF